MTRNQPSQKEQEIWVTANCVEESGSLVGIFGYNVAPLFQTHIDHGDAKVILHNVNGTSPPAWSLDEWVEHQTIYERGKGISQIDVTRSFRDYHIPVS